MTILFSDPLFERHETGNHPERKERLSATRSFLEASGLIERCRRPEIPEANLALASTLHNRGQVDQVIQLSERGGGHLDADTIVSPQSLDVATRALSTATAAVDLVIGGEDQNALCLIRPPGHHATPKTSMGFCLFNNIAVAAQRARQHHGLDRVLIVDWDVHHGNGTQDAFYGDPSVFFFSIHRFPFYPGTGDKDECGAGAGRGTTLNLPIDYGISRTDYLAAFESNLESIADRFQPQLILISAGFDAHGRDPIGSLGLETEDFVRMTSSVKEVADTHCGGRIVSCLEGGYDLEALSESVGAHLGALLD